MAFELDQGVDDAGMPTGGETGREDDAAPEALNRDEFDAAEDDEGFTEPEKQETPPKRESARADSRLAHKEQVIQELQARNRQLEGQFSTMLERLGTAQPAAATSRSTAEPAPWEQDGFNDLVVDNPTRAFSLVVDYSKRHTNDAVQEALHAFAEQIGQYRRFSTKHDGFEAAYVEGKVAQHMRETGFQDPYSAFIDMENARLRAEVESMKKTGTRQGREEAERDVRLKQTVAPAHGTPKGGGNITGKTDISKLPKGQWHEALAKKLVAQGF